MYVTKKYVYIALYNVRFINSYFLIIINKTYIFYIYLVGWYIEGTHAGLFLIAF